MTCIHTYMLFGKRYELCTANKISCHSSKQHNTCGILCVSRILLFAKNGKPTRLFGLMFHVLYKIKYDIIKMISIAKIALGAICM